MPAIPRSEKQLTAKRRDRAFLIGIASVALAICMSIVGCGGGSQSDAQQDSSTGVPTSHQGMTAYQFLQSIFSRYRNAQSYRDRGQVRLQIRSNGKFQNEVAPLSIWLDRNSLYVDAYDAHIRRTPTHLTAWMTDPTNDNFDSQVVRVRSPSDRPTLHELLSDTVLRERMAAGLAGPPPQLEWLFAAEPMKRLFDGPYKIDFGKPERVDEKDCVSIIVQAEDGVYRFAIDARAGVILRVELPSLLAPPRVQPNTSGSGASNPGEMESIRLTLNLRDATFEAPTEQLAQAVLPTSPKYVSHFIPLPPDQPSNLLMSRLSPFKTRDQTGQVTLTHRGLPSGLTLLFFASDAPGDLTSAASLIQWTAVMPMQLRRQLDFAIIVSESGFRRLPRELPVPVFIDTDGSIANSAGASKGELLVVNRDATIVWVQDQVAPTSLTKLGRIIHDLINGVDVPTRLQTQWQNDKNTYESVLRAEVIRHDQR